MRLAEALAERKALDARLSSIEGRLRANARIQEGDAVSEDPERLFALLDSTAEELRTLMVRIARTNRETVVDGRPLADWIAERDVSVPLQHPVGRRRQGVRAHRAPQRG